MNIGIDCDGVLTDMSEYIFEYGEKWFKMKPVNPNGLNVSEIFECSEKEEFLFGLRYFFTYCKKWPPRKNSAKAIRKLRREGHKLYQITARKFITQNNPLGWYSKLVYKKWLENNGFKFNGIYFCSESRATDDKFRGCMKFSVDVMIDDRPDVALFLAENGIKVFLYNTRYNQNVKHPNIERVYSWKDIYRKISVI